MINQKRIRTLLRQTEHKFITVRSTMSVLKMTKQETIELLLYLEEQGYIEASGIEDSHWQVSMRGRVLANSVVTREFKADTLQQHLNALLQRANEINESDRFPDRITCIKIIGAYPIDRDGPAMRIAYTTTRKNISTVTYRDVANRLRAAHIDNFGNIVKYHTYPLEALRLFLKSQSKVLKLQAYAAQDIQELVGHILLFARR